MLSCCVSLPFRCPETRLVIDQITRFRWSTHKFFGDRSTHKFQHKSTRKAQTFGDFPWNIVNNSSTIVIKIRWILHAIKVQRNVSTSIHFHYPILSFGSFLPKGACNFDRSRQELSSEDLVAKFGFDTAENESSKPCQKGSQLDRLS